MKTSQIEDITQQHERLGKAVTEIIAGFVRVWITGTSLLKQRPPNYRNYLTSLCPSREPVSSRF
jgi:hypothetical protein